MPDKALDTSWVGMRVLPRVRRAKRGLRKASRTARSTLFPRLGVLGAVKLNTRSIRLTSHDVGSEQVRRCDVVVLRVPKDAGSTGQFMIPQRWLDTLIEAERHSVPTVLMVESTDELDHPLAAVVTHLVTADENLLGAVEDFAGAERTAVLDPRASAKTQFRSLQRLTGVHTPVARA